jgi:hypothetical protein
MGWWIVLVALIAIALISVYLWDAWDQGYGFMGDIKREVRLEQAKERAQQIARDARARMRRM